MTSPFDDRHLIVLVGGRGQMTGATRTMLQVTDALRAPDWKLTIVAPHDWPAARALEDRGDTVVRTTPTEGGRIDRMLPPKLRRFVRNNHLDGLGAPHHADEVIWVRSSLGLLPILGLARRRGARLVWDADFEITEGPLFIPLNRALARRVSVVITQGPSISRRLFGTAWGLPRNVKAVIPALDSEATQRLTEVYESSKAMRPPVILCVGTLHPRKDQIAVLKALAIVRRHIPDVRGVFAGEPLHQGYTRRFRREVHRQGLTDVVEEVGWVDDAVGLYERASVLVHAGKREGLPHVVREAMVAGVPVVARATGATPDVIRHGETGLLVSGRSVRTLAAQVVALLTNHEQWLSMRKSAHADAIRLFQSSRWKDEYRQQLIKGVGWDR